MIRTNEIPSWQQHSTRRTPSPLIFLAYNDCLLFLVNQYRPGLIIEHEVPYVRETAAKALATALPARPELFTTYLTHLVELYQQKVAPFLSRS